MSAPAGYTKLGVVGYSDKGAYSASTVYNRYNTVTYGGGTYCCKVDNTTGIAPTDTSRWTCMVEPNTEAVDDVQQNLNTHTMAMIPSNAGVHGFRVITEDDEHKAQAYINNEWVDVSGSGSAPVTVAVPVVDDDTFTYNGTSQGITFTNLDTANILLSGATATDAGTYTATAQLKGANMTWSDDTTAPKTYTWTIAKATPTVTVSPSTLTFNKTHTTAQTLTVSSTSDATPALSGYDSTLITVTGAASPYSITPTQVSGTTNITVSVAATTNYNAASETVAVSCAFIQKFAFHYSENDSDPDSVTYPAGFDNSSWNDTAYMDFTNDTFHYGDWNPNGAHAAMLSWLFPKPCMLKYDGTVDYYLDPDDYTKKADGTASDVANSAYGGNAMMEWGQDGCKIYWKIVPDNDGKGFTFCVANGEADNDYKAWNHYNASGTLSTHFYTPIYFGGQVGSDTTKMRSISGLANFVSQTRQTEITAARANNTGASVIWDTEVYADWLFTGLLTCLISKSMDTQAKFGKGQSVGNSAALLPGTMNTKGLFWGENTGTGYGVKTWGMEHPWGNTWRALRGYINDNGTIKIKLTHGTQDGSAASDYNLDGTGYITHGANVSSGNNYGYIHGMTITNKGLTPKTWDGTDSTYYCDMCWVYASAVYYALVGGRWDSAANCGAFCVVLNSAAASARAHIGAALSCKPLV